MDNDPVIAAIGGADAKSLLLNFVDPVPDLDGVVLTGGSRHARLDTTGGGHFGTSLVRAGDPRSV